MIVAIIFLFIQYVFCIVGILVQNKNDHDYNKMFKSKKIFLLSLIPFYWVYATIKIVNKKYNEL